MPWHAPAAVSLAASSHHMPRALASSKKENLAGYVCANDAHYLQSA